MATEPRMTGIIDPPGAFASADEWRAFIAETRKLPAGAEVDVALASAAESLARAESAGGEEDDFSDLDAG